MGLAIINAITGPAVFGKIATVTAAASKTAMEAMMINSSDIFMVNIFCII